MSEEKAKKNTGLIVGIACGAVAIIAAIVIVLVVVLGNSGPSGKYVLTKMTDKDGNDLSGLLSLLSGGEAMSIEFKDGGKCAVSGFTSGFSNDGAKSADVTDCTYTKDAISATQDGEKSELKYKFEDGKVIVEEEGSSMVFEKK